MTDATSNPIPNFSDITVQIPGAAREFVRRSAADARTRTAGLQAGAAQLVGAVQDAVNVSVSGSAILGQTLLQHAFQNVEATLGMFEKLAGAKCLGDAASIHLDFVRDYGKNSVEQVRETAEIVRKGLTDSGNAVRGVFAKAKSEATTA